MAKTFTTSSIWKQHEKSQNKSRKAVQDIRQVTVVKSLMADYIIVWEQAETKI